MPSSYGLPDEQAALPRAYGFFRALVRVGFSLAGRKLRILRGETLSSEAPAILAIHHPPSFFVALALVAGSERPVRCLLNVELGFWGRALARWLGMIVGETGSEKRALGLDAAREALANGAVIALFQEPQALPEDSAPVEFDAAQLAVRLSTAPAGPLELTLVPVQIFMPDARDRAGEVIIYFGIPLACRDFLAAGAGKEPVRRLAGALDQSLRQNVFSLMDDELDLLMEDLEEVLRADLEEDWAARPGWKQTAEGFTLSAFLAECLRERNAADPGRLVGLRDQLDAYREAQRRGSLAKLEVEAAASWLAPPATRLWYWLESILGLPIAFYGFVNHLLAWAILSWRGLLKKETEGDPTTLWFLRGLVLAGCYAAQIAVCGYLWGRAAAGYYALTLPVAGGYLWRYRWLARARTRLLFVAARLPRGEEKARRLRKQLIAEIDASRDACAQARGIIP